MTRPDDLAVALTLADQADAVTLARFGALDLEVDTKPDLTPVSDADRAVETGLRETLARVRPADSILGEEFGGSTTLGRPAVDHRPDRRHQELRTGRAGMGQPDRVARRRRALRRGGQRARAAAPMVGRQRGRRVRLGRQYPGSAALGFLSGATECGQLVVLQPVWVGPAGLKGTLCRADRCGVAGARLWRLSRPL